MDYLDSQGIEAHDAAGEAREHIGRAERHGQYFEDIFNKILDQCCPDTKERWLACLDAAVVAKNSLMRKHGHSPYQIAIGHSPE
eukprot:7633748-Pyramimonas_sp.AAC.1